MKAASPLLRLPPELHFAILRFLDVRDVLVYGQTCRALLDTATSDEVWRTRVEDIVNAHLYKRAGASEWSADDEVYERYVPKLLGQGARFLGWWATTATFRGRLIRVSIRIRDDDTLAIIGEELSCRNGLFSSTNAEGPVLGRWKPQAAIWHGRGDLSYLLPENHPSPDGGYSVDILEPVLEYTPLFSITPEKGFTLVSGNTGSLTPSMPVTLHLNFRQQRRLKDTAGSSDEPTRFLDDSGPSFPSRDAVRAGILRSVDLWGQPVTDENRPGSLQLHYNYLVSPAFSIQPTQGAPTAELEANDASSSGTRLIPQRRTSSPPPREPPILVGNQPEHLVRAYLARISAALPPSIREAIFGEQPEETEQEYFYPVRGPLPDLRRSSSRSRKPGDPVLASSLEGLWAGCYAAHGYEFGYVVLRNVWTRIHTADEVALEQIYRDPDEDDEADPSVAREPLTPSLESSLRRRRTVLEFIKYTGDFNVPAGQVSWVAILPSDDASTTTTQHQSAMASYLQDTPEPDLEKMHVPTVSRADWETWSDLPPSLTRSNASAPRPRWSEGTTQAAGRIAYNAFTDTRFIDAQATFVREASGEVDEIRIRWPELGKVSCFRRCRLD